LNTTERDLSFLGKNDKDYLDYQNKAINLNNKARSKSPVDYRKRRSPIRDVNSVDRALNDKSNNLNNEDLNEINNQNIDSNIYLKEADKYKQSNRILQEQTDFNNKISNT